MAVQILDASRITETPPQYYNPAPFALSSESCYLGLSTGNIILKMGAAKGSFLDIQPCPGTLSSADSPGGSRGFQGRIFFTTGGREVGGVPRSLEEAYYINHACFQGFDVGKQV